MAQAIRLFARNGPRKRGKILFVLCRCSRRRARLLEPPVSPRVENGSPVGIPLLVSQVFLVPVPVAPVGALEAAVRKPDEGLLEDGRRGQSRLQAVGLVRSDDPPEGPERLAPFLVVVRKGLEPTLDPLGCRGGLDDAAFAGREHGSRRRRAHRRRSRAWRAVSGGP